MDLHQVSDKNSLNKKYHALCEHQQEACRSMVNISVVNEQVKRFLEQKQITRIPPEDLEQIAKFDDVEACFNILEKYDKLNVLEEAIGILSRCTKCRKKASLFNLVKK